MMAAFDSIYGIGGHHTTAGWAAMAQYRGLAGLMAPGINASFDSHWRVRGITGTAMPVIPRPQRRNRVEEAMSRREVASWEWTTRERILIWLCWTYCHWYLMRYGKRGVNE